MFQTVRLLAERNQTEMTVVCRHIHFHSFFYNRLLLQTVGNQVTDGNQFQAKFICHSTQFGQTSHCTILIHYFHKGSRRIKSSQTCHINSSLRMSGTAQHTFLLSIQWINVARTPESGRSRSRIGQRLDSSSAVCRRNAGTTAFQFINSNCEGSTQYRSIIRYLMRQIQFLATRNCNWSTKHTAGMLQHKVYFLRCNLLCCNYQITLILTVLIIHNNHKVTGFEVFNGLFYRIQLYIFHNLFCFYLF